MLQNYYYEAPKAADYAEAIKLGNERAQKAAEARAIIAAVLSNYDGKKCGAKTREKIYNESKLSGWGVWIGDDSAVYIHHLAPAGFNDGTSFVFWGQMIAKDNTINAAAVSAADVSIYSGNSIVRAAVQNVEATAEQMSRAAADVFDALKKASDAIKAYNELAEATPNLQSLSYYNVSLGCYCIQII